MYTEDEYAVRTAATHALSLIIERAFSSDTSNGLQALVEFTILPHIKKGLKLGSVVVRQEFVTLLGHLVKTSEAFGPVKDLRILLADGDEEADFFANIYHIQAHRRGRAIRRLADQIPSISSTNLGNIVVPIL